MITPRSSSVDRITPCQISRPASVTTNDGTPIFATIAPWPRPIAPVTITARAIAMSPGIVVRATGELELGDNQGGDAAEVPDREVDFPEEQHEHDAVGDHRDTRHLHDDVDEVGRREEVGRRDARRRRRSPPRRAAPARRRGCPTSRCRRLAARRRGALRLVSLRDARSRRYDVGAGAHDATSASVAAMPETFVGTPAVIACTTSCCVVLSRS